MTRRKKTKTYYKFRTEDPVWHKWKSVRYKMLNPQNSQYEYYRNLECVGLDDFDVFRDFILSEIGEPQPGDKLARRNHDVGYVPGNIQWTKDNKIIARGGHKNTFITYRGRTRILADWAKQVGMKPETISRRIRNGWPVKLAFTIEPFIGNKLRHFI
jgi:hypothetical protein